MHQNRGSWGAEITNICAGGSASSIQGRFLYVAIDVVDRGLPTPCLVAQKECVRWEVNVVNVIAKNAA